GPVTGLQRQVRMVLVVDSSRPRPGLLITRGLVTRPSTVMTASTSTTPEYFALRASSEYGGVGMLKHVGRPTPSAPARTTPPPVPPPSPGPNPPPVPEPMPVPFPCPSESPGPAARGSPR